MKTPLRVAAALGLLCLLYPESSWGQAPRVPFSGIYGGTAGAGAITGWDRSGGGDNPASLGAPGWTASAAGYAPFGLDEVRVTEAVIARDAARWGVSGSWRALLAESNRFAVQTAFKPGDGWTTGIAAGYHREEESDPGKDDGSAGVAMSGGILWRPRRWGSVGAFWNHEESRWGRGMSAGETRMGAGAEGGGEWAGVSWRLCAEALYSRTSGMSSWEYRFGAGARLHRLVSVYSGWDPPRETAALGIRFGIGNWEGFSAMRRHASLGGTSLQGIRWSQTHE